MMESYFLNTEDELEGQRSLGEFSSNKVAD